MRLLQKLLAVAILLPFISSGCLFFDEVQIAERVLVANRDLPAVESADMLQSSLIYHPQIPEIALRLEREIGIDRNTWSSPIHMALNTHQTGNRAQFQMVTPGSGGQHTSGFRGTSVPAANEIIITEHLNDITSQAQRAEWNGRVFYFLSVAVDIPGSEHSGVQFESDDFEDPARFHRVYAIDEQGSGSTFFETDFVEPVFVAKGLPRSLPDQPLQFDIVTLDEGPAVIYRDRDGIYLRQLNVNGRRGSSASLSGNRAFSFGEKQLLAKSKTPYGRFQLISRVDQERNIHLIWTDSRKNHDLWYCNYGPDTGQVCRKPKKISQTASANPVNLMVQNGKIYISWIDNRYTRGFWTRTNFAKLLLVKSDNGGRSFGKPISINPPRDQEDNVGYSVTMPAPNEGILVFWGTEF